MDKELAFFEGDPVAFFKIVSICLLKPLNFIDVVGIQPTSSSEHIGRVYLHSGKLFSESIVRRS